MQLDLFLEDGIELIQHGGVSLSLRMQGGGYPHRLAVHDR